MNDALCRRVGIAIVSALLLYPTQLQAQFAATSIKHAVACRECRVEFTKLATLGKPTDSVLISRSFTLDRDSKGRFYSFSDYSQVIVFDAQGKFLRTIGRAGDGPGEFGRTPENIVRAGEVRSPIRSVLVDKGDSIIVYHPPKITVLSPDYKYVRTVTLSPPTGNYVSGPWRVANESWLLGGDYRRDSALIGYSIHVANPGGKITRSLGVETKITPEMRIPISSQFRISGDGRSVWTIVGYSFDQWRIADNAHLASLRVTDIPWMVTARPPAGQTPNLYFLGMDSGERLWILGSTPIAPRSNVPSANRYDRTLELFDTRTRTVLSSQKLSSYMTLFPKGDASYSAEQSLDGIITVTAWAFRLVGR